MEVSLSGRSVLVTGAASGIGEAVARLAAVSGARLLLTDRDGDGLTRIAAELGAEAVVADLLDSGALEAIGSAVRARPGGIDGLLNAAGPTTRTDFRAATPEIWERLFAVNACAPLFLVAETVANMTSWASSWTIVNFLSVDLVP